MAGAEKQDRMPQAPPARIVELGGFGYLSRVRPETAALLWTSEEDPPLPAAFNVREFSLGEWWRLLRAARRNMIDLVIVITPTRHPPWHWRPLRSLVHRPLAPWRRLVRLFGILAVRLLPEKIPLFVIDLDDMRTIPRHHAFLLDRCTYYFKRELPIDRWQVFQRTAHPELPSTRFRRKPRNRARIGKLRPWSIGYAAETAALAEERFPDKSIDLFAAVSINSSTVRLEGLAELRKLAARRPGIFIADRRMSRAEYFAAMSRAWLTWSPEGFGWDCMRHYEAAVCHSVPVMNRPTIVRHRPLLDGVHAVYYDADIPGALAVAIEQALADLGHLRDMAMAARAHVGRFHLAPWCQAEALLQYLSGQETPPGGLIPPD
jgi:hypothetical protein